MVHLQRISLFGLTGMYFIEWPVDNFVLYWLGWLWVRDQAFESIDWRDEAEQWRFGLQELAGSRATCSWGWDFCSVEESSNSDSDHAVAHKNKSSHNSWYSSDCAWCMPWYSHHIFWGHNDICVVWIGILHVFHMYPRPGAEGAGLSTTDLWVGALGGGHAVGPFSLVAACIWSTTTLCWHGCCLVCFSKTQIASKGTSKWFGSKTIGMVWSSQTDRLSHFFWGMDGRGWAPSWNPAGGRSWCRGTRPWKVGIWELQGLGDFDRAAMCEEQRSTQIHQVGRFNFLPLSPPFFPYLFWTQNHSPTTAFKTEFQKKTQLVATYGSIGISPVYPQLSSSSYQA